MRTITRLPLLLLVSFFVTGCPEQQAGPEGAETPQKAVVQWLAAVNDGDFEAAAALAPPAAAGPEVKQQLQSQFTGAKRADQPFAMSEPEAGKAMATAWLEFPSGRKKVRLDLESQGGKWFVVASGEPQAEEAPAPAPEAQPAPAEEARPAPAEEARPAEEAPAGQPEVPAAEAQ